MPDERKRQTLPPERLREVLARLDDVLAEAERLRTEITRQIESQHFDQQQHLSAAGKTPPKAKPPRTTRRRRKPSPGT